MKYRILRLLDKCRPAKSLYNATHNFHILFEIMERLEYRNIELTEYDYEIMGNMLGYSGRNMRILLDGRHETQQYKSYSELYAGGGIRAEEEYEKGKSALLKIINAEVEEEDAKCITRFIEEL